MRDLFEINIRFKRNGLTALHHTLHIDPMMLEMMHFPDTMVLDQFLTAWRRFIELKKESENWSEEEWEARARRTWRDKPEIRPSIPERGITDWEKQKKEGSG